MLSYRAQLDKVGAGADPISYRDLWLPVASLRALMRSADVPASFAQVIPGTELDKNWTEEVQGCAWGHNRWFYTSNDDSGRRLHVFDGATGKKVKSWNLEGMPLAPLPGFEVHHIGHIIIDGDNIYIDHWYDNLAQVLVLRGDGETLAFSKWIPLDNVNGKRVVMLAMDFARRWIITCGPDINISEVFLHRFDGKFANKRLSLNPPITDGGYAQGGFWSPNNHLYISSGRRNIGSDHQSIYCYSPLTGLLQARIPVPALSQRQELEGICYAPLVRKGHAVQIHAVLLENEDLSKDDIYLKSFAADRPDLI